MAFERFCKHADPEALSDHPPHVAGVKSDGPRPSYPPKRYRTITGCRVIGKTIPILPMSTAWTLTIIKRKRIDPVGYVRGSLLQLRRRRTSTSWRQGSGQRRTDPDLL